MRRFARLRHALTLDADEECHLIYRLLSEYEFPWDMRQALELALFRTYAVPSIGKLLDRTGEFRDAPQKRYDDTSLLLYEILRWGNGHPRSAEALERLNTIHGMYRISNEDYRYTLATFVVMPVRWIEAYGWRRLHPHEVRALTNTMRRMGSGMGISGVPGTYAEFARLLDDYEHANFADDEGGRRVADATLGLFGSRFPGPFSGLARAASRVLMDPPLRHALGQPAPAVPLRHLVHSVLRARAKVVRFGPARPDSRPLRVRFASYPDGYEIADVGPRAFHRHRANRPPAVDQTL